MDAYTLLNVCSLLMLGGAFLTPHPRVPTTPGIVATLVGTLGVLLLLA